MSLSLPIFHNIIISEIWVGHIAIDVGHTAAYVDVHQMLLLSSFPSVLEILRGTSTSLTSRVQRCCPSFASDAQHAPPASNSIRYCVPLPRRRCSSARRGTCSSHRWDAQGSRSTPSAAAGAPPAAARAPPASAGAPPAPPPWAAAAPLRALRCFSTRARARRPPTPTGSQRSTRRALLAPMRVWRYCSPRVQTSARGLRSRGATSTRRGRWSRRVRMPSTWRPRRATMRCSNGCSQAAPIRMRWRS